MSPKSAFIRGRSRPPWFLGPTRVSSKRHFDWFSRFAQLTGVPDAHADTPTHRPRYRAT